MAELAQVWPEENQGRTMRAVGVPQSITGGSQRTIVMLGLGAGLMVLITCADIANPAPGQRDSLGGASMRSAKSSGPLDPGAPTVQMDAVQHTNDGKSS